MITLSEAQAGKLLAGRAVEVSVGEPWDFSSPDGANLLRGRIASVSAEGTASADQEVVLEVTPFEAEGGVIVSRLRASLRHVDETGIIEYLVTGGKAIANMSYREQIPEGSRDPRSSQFLIGSFRLADWQELE